MSSGEAPASANESAQKKKKIVVASVSTLLLLAVAATVATIAVRREGSSDSDSSSSGGIQKSSRSIQSICQPTDFREQCEDSLSKAAGNTTDPKDLVQAAFKVIVGRVREAFDHSQTV